MKSPISYCKLMSIFLFEKTTHADIRRSLNRNLQKKRMKMRKFFFILLLLKISKILLKKKNIGDK